MNHREKGEALHKTLRKQTLMPRNDEKMMTRREIGVRVNAAGKEGSEIRDMLRVWAEFTPSSGPD